MGDAGVAWLREQIEGDRARAQHILDARGAHPDPRREMHDAIADCDAKLAILDEHAPAGWVHEMPAPAEPPRDPWQECAAGDGAYPCRTVCLTASGYRHRDGYAGHWGERAGRTERAASGTRFSYPPALDIAEPAGLTGAVAETVRMREMRLAESDAFVADLASRHGPVTEDELRALLAPQRTAGQRAVF